MTVSVDQIADQAIGLFLEYRDQHGYSEETARLLATNDVVEGSRFLAELRGSRDEPPAPPRLS